jgi:hypothetical protein
MQRAEKSKKNDWAGRLWRPDETAVWSWLDATGQVRVFEGGRIHLVSRSDCGLKKMVSGVWEDTTRNNIDISMIAFAGEYVKEVRRSLQNSPHARR